MKTINEMAREAGATSFYTNHEASDKRTTDAFLVGQGFLHKFHAIVRAAERERIALLLDDMHARDRHSNCHQVAAAVVRALED